MKKLLVLLLLILSFKASSQTLALIDTTKQNFRKDLIHTYNESVEKQLAVFKETLKDRKTQKEVIGSYKELSSDFISQINKGYFVESPTYTQLFDKILKQIAEANPKFIEINKTKIVLSFGSKANAYAIGNDIVVVMIPLLKNLKNEQQLAFILSHEIAHNLLNHTYNDLIEYAELIHSKELKNQTRSIEKERYNKGEVASGLYKNIVYGKRKNSRKLEYQADSLGLVLYKNAFKFYENEAVATLLELGNLDVEKDSLVFDDYSLFFGTQKFPIKRENYEQSKINEYSYDKTVKFWLIDSLKTHPDSEQRAAFIQKQLQGINSKPIEESKEFATLIQSSNYNHILGLFVTENYGESLYEAFILLKRNPDDLYLLNLVYQNLIQLQKAQNEYKLNRYLDTASPKFSESYNIFLNFFRQQRKAQLQELIDKYAT